MKCISASFDTDFDEYIHHYIVMSYRPMTICTQPLSYFMLTLVSMFSVALCRFRNFKSHKRSFSSSIIKIGYYRRNFTPGTRCYFCFQTSTVLRMGYHPCLCLCFGFSQITRILPFLLMILHLSQIGFTDALTFIKILSFRKKSVANNHCIIFTKLMQVKFSKYYYFSLHLILPFVRS